MWSRRHEKLPRDANGDVEASAPVSAHPTSDNASDDPSSSGMARTGTVEGEDKEKEPKKDTKKKKETVEPFSREEIDAMEDLLEKVSGNLVVFPTRFLEVRRRFRRAG